MRHYLMFVVALAWFVTVNMLTLLGKLLSAKGSPGLALLVNLLGFVFSLFIGLILAKIYKGEID